MSYESLAQVQEYYGKVLQSQRDLMTTACCVTERLPPAWQAIVDTIHPEVKEKFYGCGLTIPMALEGLTVLDLGSGSGRDAYLLSRLVGPRGRVIGIDMTPEQLAVARRHRDYHADQFGFANVEFVEGYIEDLEAAGIASQSVDLVVSNCVFNLSPNKPKVFAEVARVLKPGGELYFSDVFCDRRQPAHHQLDPVLLGECLGGALYIEDFRRALERVGLYDHRTVTRSPITITDPKVAAKVGAARFSSHTIRAFRLHLEDRCEDYGQVATYQGTLADAPHFFVLDDHHRFEKGRPMLVCRNTAAMLSETRFAPHFRIEGEATTHFGLFPCGPAAGPAETTPAGCC